MFCIHTNILPPRSNRIRSISATGEHGSKLKPFKTQKEIASSHVWELVCQQHDWWRECFTLTAKVDGQQTDTFLCHLSTQQILNSIFPWHCLHWWRLFCHLGLKFLCPSAKWDLITAKLECVTCFKRKRLTVGLGSIQKSIWGVNRMQHLNKK